MLTLCSRVLFVIGAPASNAAVNVSMTFFLTQSKGFCAFKKACAAFANSCDHWGISDQGPLRLPWQ